MNFLKRNLANMELIKRITRGTCSKSMVLENREKYLAMNKDEKRKFYKCRENFISLNEIKTWPDYYQEYEIKEKQKSEVLDIEEIPNKDLNSKLGVFIGDITCLEIDCIVNAANKTLLGGGGVDGAIHKAAGPMLLSECEVLNGCETSQAKITAGYNLPAKYIIHTVGPIGYKPEALKTAYLNCLELATENKCRSIAFPCISTGIYGFPNDKASMIVSKTLREYLEKNHEKFDRIILCLFLEKDIELYEKFLNIYFPIDENQLFKETKKQTNSNASSNSNEIKSENKNEKQTETANESKNENKSDNENENVNENENKNEKEKLIETEKTKLNETEMDTNNSNNLVLQKPESDSAELGSEIEKRFVTRHSSSLVQLPNPPQVSPNPEHWKCEKCDISKNLWLNLSDGKILCGRKQFDGSGGNNHAVEHYSQVKYPLAVKLGTINAQGADVYSYDEDDMVEDTNLAVHLSHFGINMSKMQKSDKTMAELEIDLNQRVGEWDRIQESGSKLVPLYGPGYTGMRNLGNSCYINSVMQVIFTLPDFLRKYLNNRDSYLKNSAIDASNDFNFQMSKLAYGLVSGEYSKKEEPEQPGLLRPPKGIKPISFKSLIGKGHAEFSTKRQQDAHEFLMHLISLIERNLRNDTANNFENPTDCLKFKLEDRTECAQSHRVKYTSRDDYCLAVPISKELALNKEKLAEFEKRKADLESKGKKLEPGDIVRPEINLMDCLKMLTRDDEVTDFYSSATKSKGIALKSTRLATFPDFMLIQAKKFEFAADWTPIKLDVSLQVPDVLDLTELRGTGKKPNEQELPEDDSQQPQVTLNEAIVQQLIDMGFSLEGSKRAAYNTREANDAESAVNWAVAHMEDNDFNLPFQLPQNKPTAAGSNAKKNHSEDSIESITSMGFTRPQAIKALDSTNGDVTRAVDWIFSHMDDLMDTSEPGHSEATQSMPSEFRDGSGKYKLVAFISHMGTNANVGHYVAHILKDDKWSIFNDENVAQSENPPKDLAYLYLFKRI